MIDRRPRGRHTRTVTPSPPTGRGRLPCALACALLVTALAGWPGSATAEEGRTVAIDEEVAADDAATTSTITRAEMQDALSDLGEVLDRQPGLRVSRQGGLGSFATASLRGSTAEQVLVLLDGLPLVSAEGGPVDLGMLPLGCCAA